MTAQQFKILKEGVLKVGKNQIYFDDFSNNEPCFIVEKFEFVDKGQDMFSVVDGFDTFEKAYMIAKNPSRYNWK
ncbi:MAG: hypothetical protein WDA59_07305 [Methanofastidiosum sp.]|jgi:hypothetical protein